jgi:hypothetical protein
VSVSAVEGNPFVGVVANFTDADPLSQPSDFAALIDWGDGSAPTAGVVVAGNGLGAYLVIVDAAHAHTYTDETGSALHPQPYNISVKISETDGSGASVMVDGFANVADASLISATGIDPTGAALEGNPLAAAPITLATFIDSNPLATPADYIANGVTGAALINWGDGSTSLGAIVDTGPTPLGESFAVTGDHTYDKVGPSTITISVVDIGGKTTSMVANVDVIDAPLAATAATLTGVEGFPLLNAAGSDLVTVATFTDGNPDATPMEYKVTIDWGDGSGGSGTVLSGAAAGSFIVVSSHKYAEAGTYPVNILIDDSAGDNGGSRAVANGSAVIADAPLMNVAANPVGGTEGSGLSGVTLGTFTDINPAGKTSDFTVTIGWGDGSATDTLTGSVAITGGTSTGISAAANIAAGTGTNFKITGNHTYKEEGSFTITVAVADADGNTFTLTTTATIVDAPLPDIEIGPQTATAGVALPKGTLVGRFQDANVGATVDDFVAVADYGDGNGNVGATVESLGGGGFQILMANPVTYPKPGIFPIVAYVRDQGGNIIAIGRNVAFVAAGQPPAPVLAPAVLRGVEGANLDPVIASFTDASPSATPADFEATIDWGDGTTSQGAISLVGGTTTQTDFQVSGDHFYAEEGAYAIDVTVTTLGTNPVATTSTANIADAPLTAEHATFDAPEGVSMTESVATFTDANPDAPIGDFSAVIDWGDGTQSDGTITQPNGPGTPFLVTGTHEYDDSEDGNVEMDGWPVTVTITDIGGSVAIATSQANTFDPVLIDPGVAVQAVAGSPFQGNVATFSTTDLSASTKEFTAVINWGDGQSSPGTIVSTGSGGFRVVGDHTYAQPGSFSASSTVTDDEGQSVSDTTTATVSAPPIVGQGLTIALGHRKSFSGKLATFTSPVAFPAGQFSALINWGDGTSSSGVVAPDGNSTGATTFTVSGSHHFSRRKPSAVAVTIVESGGGQTVIPIRTSVGVNHRGDGSRQQQHGPESLGVTHGLVLDKGAHPAGPHALLQAGGHLKTGWFGVVPRTSRTTALYGRKL